MDVEAAAMQLLHSCCPAHIPQLYAYDPAQSILAMQCAPPPHQKLLYCIRQGQVLGGRRLGLEGSTGGVVLLLLLRLVVHVDGWGVPPAFIFVGWCWFPAFSLADPARLGHTTG